MTRRKMASASASASASSRDQSEQRDQSDRRAEDEPLLGTAGGVSQHADKNMAHNLWQGTGIIAQAGIWILAGVVWGNVFSHDLIFVSAHPLLNSAGLLLITQGMLILQPTHTPKQKKNGTYAHAALIDLGQAALVAALVVIVINKNRIQHDHFDSPHAVMGLLTYVLMVVQGAVGGTMFFFPQLYGSEARAKAIWKYHRMSGYAVFVLALATVAAATQTTYNLNVLHIPLWAVLVAAVLTLVGIVPRIKKRKLGF